MTVIKLEKTLKINTAYCQQKKGYKNLSWKRIKYFLLFVFLLLSLSACDFIQKPDYETIEAIPSLWKEYKEHFPIGVAVNATTINTHSDLIEKHFLSITAENEMKPQTILPGYYTSDYLDRLNFTQGDRMIKYARENDKIVRGHVLVWHEQTPEWFFKDEKGEELSPEALLERMEEYIKAVVGRYKGQIYAWDVVNEVISDDSDEETYRTNSRWNQIFKGREIDYIEAAFRAAKEADPEAKLFYNDYGAVSPKKRAKIISMLEELIARGVPIDGMGIQGHWAFDGWPSKKDIEDSIIDYSNLGLDVQITELDIRKHTGEMFKDVTLSKADKKKQAEKYKEVFEIFIKHRDKISGVTFWGVTDDNSWIPQEPLIFDRNKNPKHAFWAILEALGE